MPTFDIVSKLDMQEVDNTINMVTRDISNRYDFKGSSTKISLNKNEKTITLLADNEMQLNAVNDMLQNRAVGRKLSVKIFDYQNTENASGMSVRQTIKLKKELILKLQKKSISLSKN